MLLLCETIAASGVVERSWLEWSERGLMLRVEQEGADAAERWALPEGAVQAVMTRYGRPTDQDVTISSSDCIELGHHGKLCAFRFRSRYDVIAKDYVAWFAPDGSVLVELGISVCAALMHLARALRASSPPMHD